MRCLYLFIFVFIITNCISATDTLLTVYANKTFAISSSELDVEDVFGFGKYGVKNLLDKDSATAWVEGVDGSGIGEFVFVHIPFSSNQLRINNGYQKNEGTYKANNRLRKMQIFLYQGFQPHGFVTEYYDGFILEKTDLEWDFEINDQMGEQNIKLEIPWEALDQEKVFFVKIIIKEVYKGLKWDDTCISDIYFAGAESIELTSDEFGMIRIQENSYDTLFYNKEFIFQIIEADPEKRYYILIRMLSNLEESRGEVEYFLYDTKDRKEIIIEGAVELYDFVVKDNQLFIEGLSKEISEIKLFEIPEEN